MYPTWRHFDSHVHSIIVKQVFCQPACGFLEVERSMERMRGVVNHPAEFLIPDLRASQKVEGIN